MLVGDHYQANKLFINGGTGGFTRSTSFPDSVADTNSVTFADVGMPINGAKAPDSG